MLETKIASALKRIISNQFFRRRVDVEEQTAQKHDRFLRGRQTADMMYEHFRAIGAHEAALDLSDLFNVSSQVDVFRISILDGTKLYYLQVKYLNVLESLYKMKIRESVKLQTVLAIYEQEIDRHRAMSSCQRLKTIVRRRIDQMIRTE